MGNAKWYRLDLATSHGAADLATQLLITVGCKGASIESREEWSIVTGYLPFDGRGDGHLAEVERRLTIAKSCGLCRADSSATLSQIADQDWAENWKRFFTPIEVGTKFRIVPPWLNGDEDRGSRTEDRNTKPLQSSIPNPRSSIIIEPGMAFGTGQHATTVLCLEMLEATVRAGDTVLDVGTGSGILAIAAAKLGARKVLAIDSDPVCPPAAAKNAAMNGVSDCVRVINGDLLACLRGRFDVVVANLTSFGIASLSAEVAGYLRARGMFIASGIPEDKAVEVSQAIQAFFPNSNFEVRSREGWVAIATRICPA